MLTAVAAGAAAADAGAAGAGAADAGAAGAGAAVRFPTDIAVSCFKTCTVSTGATATAGWTGTAGVVTVASCAGTVTGFAATAAVCAGSASPCTEACTVCTPPLAAGFTDARILAGVLEVRAEDFREPAVDFAAGLTTLFPGWSWLPAQPLFNGARKAMSMQLAS